VGGGPAEADLRKTFEVCYPIESRIRPNGGLGETTGKLLTLK